MPPSDKPPHKAARKNPYARPPQPITSTSTSTTAADVTTASPSFNQKESKAQKKKKNKREKSRSRSHSLAGPTPTVVKDGSVGTGTVLDTTTSAPTPTPAPRKEAHESATYKRIMQITANHDPLTSNAKPTSSSPLAAVVNDNSAASEGLTPSPVHKDIKSKEKVLARIKRQLEQHQEEAKRKEENERLKKQLEKSEKDAAAMEAELKMKIEELEKQVTAQQELSITKDQAIKDNQVMRDSLKEAVGCGVCMEVFDDPHILSCGHVACKICLQRWFRTPGAYVHEIFEDITADTNLSHRSKACHVCRAIVLRRPARVFFLREILEPLGLSGGFPTASQDQVDPWDKIFPVEPETYRIYDESDGIWRCPTCTCEIDEGRCQGCGNQFSDLDVDDEGDWDSEEDEIGSVLEGMGLGAEDNGYDEGEESDGEITSDDDGSSRARTVPYLAPGVHDLLDLLDTEAAADDDDMSGSESDRREGTPSDYGGSFIDDDSVQYIGSEDGDLDDDLDGSEVGLEDQGNKEDELDSDSDGSVSGNSEQERQSRSRPTSDELSRRRVQMHTGTRGGIPPLVRRAASTEQEGEGEESPVIRQLRRRPITIVSDDSDEE